MSRKYTNCLSCGKKVSKNCHFGYCSSCRDRSGKNNSFYGKKHTKETIEKIKKKNSIISKNLWKNEEYRNRVICGVSKPRRKGFSKEQSERVKKWYEDNPEQIKIRSGAMKKSWREGKINYSNTRINKSRGEKELFNMVKSVCSDAKFNHTIKLGGRRWVKPDIFIPDYNMVVEYYGNFWHANPKMYNKYDVIIDDVTAGQIWDKDRNRINAIENLGYLVDIIWEDDFKDGNISLIGFLTGLDWETCSI